MYSAYHLGGGQLAGLHFALLLRLLHQVQSLPTFLPVLPPLPHPPAKEIRLLWAAGPSATCVFLGAFPFFNPFKTTFAD